MIKSVYTDKVEIRESDIIGKGVFAKENIMKDEVVFIKGGHILKRKAIFASSVINSYSPIDDEYYIGATNIEEEKSVKIFVNHSCDANCGIRGDIVYVAMRDIKKGEELTIDYAILDNEDYSFQCSCDSKNCRKTITGFDWKIKDLQEKYKGYFVAYLQKKIEGDKS